MRHLSKAKRLLILSTTILAVAAIAVGAFVVRQPSTHAAAGMQVSLQSLTSRGTGTFGSSPNGLAGDTLNQAVPHVGDPDQHTNAHQANAPTTNPNPTGNKVTPGGPAVGFQGLDHYDTRTRDSGNAFSLEPPDQGLCVGNGYVLESVNDVMVVTDKAGNRLTTPTSMNTFFKVAPAVIRSTPRVYGPFLSDPKCLYDSATNRWFLTMLELDTDPATGGFTNHAATYLAVSQTADPRGAWNLFSVDATDDGSNGTQNHAGCPCGGDQPLIGADANGFYISTNEYSIKSFAGLENVFNGAQVYAISKRALAAGTMPTVVHINAGSIPTPDAGGIWYSLQPATAPAGAQGNDTGHGGTEFFMSSLQFGPAPLDNRIAVWSLSNTSALDGSHPDAVTLAHTVIGSEVYGQPNPVTQKAGDYPLGQALGEPMNYINSNDDRMNQVVDSNGLLWSGVNTVIGNGSNTGIAYFIVQPQLNAQGLSASMASQGYVSVAGNSVLYPAIGVNASGNAVMTFTVAGPGYFPSAGYATINVHSGAGHIHIVAAGAGPSDGFTGYPEYGGGAVSRWGDYSAAVADRDGTIWFATEYIGQTCTLAQWSADSTCGGTRTSLANWSTFVASVSPDAGN